MMHRQNDVYRFGPFELNSAHRRLIRGRDPVALPDRHVQILLVLAANAGHVVTKEALMEAVWRDVIVAENSLERGIWNVRKALGTQPDGAPYIETLARQGYRFLAPVERGEPLQSSVQIETLLAPYRAFVDGRAALETLDRDAVVRARRAFEEALRAEPDHPAAHIGMANACVLAFESTRADLTPDLAALAQADRHAREGCRLDPSSGDAWGTLAFVLHRNGDAREATAAARKALRLEPDDWRHYVRLASVSWGEERLRAAHRSLMLCPGLALAHWFAATVFIARQAFDAALEQVRAGSAAQDTQHETGRFNAVGLHLLHGLLLASRGAVDEALEQFQREIGAGNEGQIYARECLATTWYAIGALRLRQRRRDDADAAFQESLARAPGHRLAPLGLAAVVPTPDACATATHVNNIDAAIAMAAVLARAGEHDAAASVCGQALAQADPGPAGWLLPVEPLLHVAAHPGAWAQTLAILRHRAV
jgi:DNA-binding winged helix-turn-helix (wHTH) protein/Tfp pilus assembly protein PilF